MTEDDLRAAIEAVKSNVPVDRCPPHLVHPRYVSPDWELVGHDEPVGKGDRMVGCANLSGTWFAFRPTHRADEAIG